MAKTTKSDITPELLRMAEHIRALYDREGKSESDISLLIQALTIVAGPTSNIANPVNRSEDYVIEVSSVVDSDKVAGYRMEYRNGQWRRIASLAGRTVECKTAPSGSFFWPNVNEQITSLPQVGDIVACGFDPRRGVYHITHLVLEWQSAVGTVSGGPTYVMSSPIGLHGRFVPEGISIEDPFSVSPSNNTVALVHYDATNQRWIFPPAPSAASNDADEATKFRLINDLTLTNTTVFARRIDNAGSDGDTIQVWDENGVWSGIGGTGGVGWEGIAVNQFDSANGDRWKIVQLEQYHQVARAQTAVTTPVASATASISTSWGDAYFNQSPPGEVSIEWDSSVFPNLGDEDDVLLRLKDVTDPNTPVYEVFSVTAPQSVVGNIRYGQVSSLVDASVHSVASSPGDPAISGGSGYVKLLTQDGLLMDADEVQVKNLQRVSLQVGRNVELTCDKDIVAGSTWDGAGGTPIRMVWAKYIDNFDYHKSLGNPGSAGTVLGFDGGSDFLNWRYRQGLEDVSVNVNSLTLEKTIFGDSSTPYHTGTTSCTSV